MRITWVLSDHQRRSRYNKLNNANQAVLRFRPQVKYQRVTRPLYFSFFHEEQLILDNLGSTMQSPSPGSLLQSLVIFDREAAVNLIEYTYGLDELKVRSWETFKRSMGFNFGKYILPRFQEVSELSPHDIS